MENENSPQNVKCPRCGRFCLYAPENPYRPFCSERCKTIDLGSWASNEYKVPTSQPFDPEKLEEDDTDPDT